jgi:hypothetical protein
MKLIACVLMICGGLAAADKPVKKAPAPLKVPANAVLVEPGLYRWVDRDGKTWMFRKTPFGVRRWAETAEDAKLQSVVENTTAVDQGDAVRFERVTPFGKRTWVRKKSELDATERKIWEHAQQPEPASRKTEKE